MTATSLQRANTTERSQLAVEIRGLSKSFGRTKALDSLDLTVTPASLEDLFLREYQGVNR